MRARQCLDDVAAQHGLALGVLDVDDRRFADDRDRFGDRADLQVGVDRGGEGAGQLDAVALDGVEPGQRERHRVRAGPQIDDAVLAGSRRSPRISDFSMSTGLAASTVTPGSTAPDYP